MKLGDRHLGGERLELRSLKQFHIGPCGGNQEGRIELEYKTAGIAMEISTNQTPLFNSCEKRNLDILNSNQKFKGHFFDILLFSSCNSLLLPCQYNPHISEARKV